MLADDPIPLPDEYLAYFRLFNERRYFDAHEVLEDLWVVSVEPERTYYKGLIMWAVAILHWQRGNRSGARRLFRDGARYLGGYPPDFESFDLGAFRDRMAALFAPLMSEHWETATAPPDAAVPVIGVRE